MASQIIHLSAATIDAIRLHRAFPRAHAFGIRDQEMQSIVVPDGSKALRIHTDPLAHFPELRSPYVDDFYALLLASCESISNLALPQALPQNLVVQQLDLAEAALLELPHLTGHDKIDIAGGFLQARDSDAATCSGNNRAATATEASILAEALGLQHDLAPVLRYLDEELADYQIRLAASGLEAAVLRLGMQAELGAKLQLDSVGDTLLPSLAGGSRYHFIDRWRRTQNRLAGF